MSNLIIPYTTLADYSFDSNKVEVDSGLAKIKENLSNVYARWHLNESSGANVPDTGILGTRNGTTQNMEDADWVAGKLNNCLQFDGVDEYVNCGNIAGFERTDSFSVEFWLKTTISTFQMVIGKQDTAANGRGWVIYSSNSGGEFNLELALSSDYPAGNYITARTNDLALNDDAWHHYIITYDGSSLVTGITFYIDGSEYTTRADASNTLSATILNSVNLEIASRKGGVNNLTGSLDEMVIYDRVLTPVEVTYRYNSSTGRENFYYLVIDSDRDRLAGYWKFEDDLLDSSDWDKNGINNSVTFVAGKVNKCGSFNGSSSYVNFNELILKNHNKFSIAIWFNTNDTSVFQTIFSQYDISASAVPMPSIEIVSNKVRFRVGNESGGSTFVETPVTTGWHFVVVTMDGNDMNLYLDDGSAINATFSGVKRIVETANIGARAYTSTDSFFDGLIDETIIYEDRILSVSERTSLYNSGVGRVLNNKFTDIPTIEPTTLFDPATVLSWDDFLETLGGGNRGSVAYNLYKVDKINRYYWNGSAWVTGGSSSNYNIVATISANISTFDATPDKIGYIVYMLSNGEQIVELDENIISYTDNQVPLVNAGIDKNVFDNQSISPFSDCTFSDADGTVDFARYKIDSEVDVWTNIPQGGYGNLQEAVQAFSYQFNNPNILTTRLQVEDNDGSMSEDDLIVSVLQYTKTVNIRDAVTNVHLLGVFFDPGDGTGSTNKSSPFTYSWDLGNFNLEFTKDGYNDKARTISVSDESVLDLVMTEQSVLNQCRASIGLLTDSDKIAVSGWLEINGSVITTPTSCEIWLFDSDDVEQYHPAVNSSPNAEGIFSFSKTPSGLPDTQIYHIKVKIIYAGVTYISLISKDKINREKVFPEYQVYIDVDNGEPGTAYPIGTQSRPVDNLADALVIANANSLQTFHVTGSLNVLVTDDISDLIFVNNGHRSNGIILNNSNADGAIFRLIKISGTVNGEIEIDTCRVGTLTGFQGVIKDSVLAETVTLAGSDTINILDCRSGVAGTGLPEIDMGGSGRSLGVRSYAGGIKIKNKTGTEDISLDFISGQVNLDATVTDGTIVIRGNCTVTNNSTATVIDQSIHTLLLRDLGLSKENYRLFTVVRTGGLVTSAKVKIYPTSADVDADTNHIAEYDIDATYINDLISDYKVKKI